MSLGFAIDFAKGDIQSGFRAEEGHEDEKDEDEKDEDEKDEDEKDEDEKDEDEDEEEEDEEEEEEGSGSGGSSGGSGSGGPVSNNGYAILVWNNLGMHCMDDDYQVFSILPPYNTLNAHLVKDGNLLEGPNYKLTYEAVQDPSGSINSSSVGKTNFWEKGHLMYGNGALVPDVGLEGYRMPGSSNQPQDFQWNGSGVVKWFEANGIPIAPTDDAGQPNSYPLMRVKAWDGSGNQLAQVDVVLPVSDEMDCRKCHASGSGNAAKPSAGWVNDAVDKHDFRLNILRLHDEKELGSSRFQNALQSVGYSADGLFATVKNGTPILCANCHSSEALPGTGIAGIPALTQVMHASHADVISPDTNLVLDAASNRSACYQCHPGSSTQCLRGAMGSAIDPNNGNLAMQCQDCHGSMSQVGSSNRVGWMDEPNCQSCHTGTAVHNNGQIRYTSVFDSSGNMRQAVNSTFATNPNTPVAGVSLYRFSEGHGGLQCSACHGSTHAIWPSVHSNDNILSEQLQGHDGVIVECATCHSSVPNTTSGGPHGMHPIDQSWISRHEDVSHRNCQDCHGSDGGGTVLSTAKADRSFSAEGSTIQFWKGQTVGCYECHNGADGEGRAPSRPSISSQTNLIVAAGSNEGSASVAVTPSNGTRVRIVSQPSHGTAVVNQLNVVYYRSPGYVGSDTFTVAASNGKRESTLGTVAVSAN